MNTNNKITKITRMSKILGVFLKIGAIAFIVATAAQLAGIVALSVVVPPLHSLLALFLVSQGQINMNIELGTVAVAVMFYCLALIFDYGLDLQQQADETL